MNTMPRTLYFVRHGQSLSNAGGLTMEDAEVPLTETGLTQANALAERLPVTPSAVFASPYLRTRDTAMPYARQVGIDILLDHALHEFRNIDADLLQGMTGIERRPIALAFWEGSDPHRRMGPRAETFAEFDARVQTFIAGTLPRLSDRSVLFGHGRWIGLLIWKLSGGDTHGAAGMRAFWNYACTLPMPNTAVYRFTESHQGGGWNIAGP